MERNREIEKEKEREEEKVYMNRGVQIQKREDIKI